jgi:acyl-[acyl carrier protein]--UDP-N-acetylglucosamine O-acyltransferase
MQDFFGGNGYTAVRIGNNNNIIVRSFYAYNSGTGDSIPNTYGIGNNMIMIEPIMFC